MSEFRRWIERKTGFAWHSCRNWPVNPWGRTWLVVAPRQDDQLFTIVVGRWGFAGGRINSPTPPSEGRKQAPDCVCGGISACLPCQERDAADPATDPRRQKPAPSEATEKEIGDE